MFVNIFILENFSVDVRVAFFTVVSSVISFPAFKLLGKNDFFSTIALDLAHRNCSLTSLTNSQELFSHFADELINRICGR